MSSLEGIPKSLITENKWRNFSITDSPEIDAKSFKTITFNVKTKGLECIVRRIGAIALGIFALFLIPLCFEGYRNLTSFLWNGNIAQPLTTISKDPKANENGIVKEGMILLKIAHERKLSDDTSNLYKVYVQTQIIAEYGNLPDQTATADLKYTYWSHFQKAGLPQEHLNLLDSDYAPAAVSLASLSEQHNEIEAIVLYAKAAQQAVTHDTPQLMQEAIAKGTLERDRLINQFLENSDPQKNIELVKALIEEKLEVGFTLLDQLVEKHNPYAMLFKGQYMLDHPPAREIPEEAEKRTTEAIVSFSIVLNYSASGQEIVDPSLRAAALSHLQNLFETLSINDRYHVYRVLTSRDQNVALILSEILNKQIEELVEQLLVKTAEKRVDAIKDFKNHSPGLTLMVADQLIAKGEYDLASAALLMVFEINEINTAITETIQKLKDCYSHIIDLPLSIRIYNTLQVKNAEGTEEIEEQLMVKVLKDQEVKQYFVTTLSDSIAPELQFAIAQKLEEQNDHNLAFKLYEKAADSYPEAVLELARCYKEGIGVDSNEYTADAYNMLYKKIRSPIVEESPIHRLIAKRHKESWGAFLALLSN